VADDYNWRLFNAMQFNSDPYSQMINEVAKTQGLETSEQWTQCARTNGTYLDCPAFITGETFYVAIQNPSLQAVKYSKIRVPEGNYSV
jgi:hypothetical protein